MPYEIDFLPVGDSNGDAIVIRDGSDAAYYLHVVDGGFVDTADVVIRHIERTHGTGRIIHHLVLTHADNDHAPGLIGILEHFDVRNIWMNRPWLWAAKCIDSFHGNFGVAGLVDSVRASHTHLVEIEKIAQKRGIPIHDVFQGATGSAPFSSSRRVSRAMSSSSLTSARLRRTMLRRRRRPRATF